MRLIPITLGLAATVAAVDIRLFISAACRGDIPHASCANINPDTCCGTSRQDLKSVGFFAVPTTWSLEYRSHGGGNCGPVKETWRRSGVVDTCLKNYPPYSGGGYSFTARKRANAQCQKPDTLVFPREGTTLNITALSDASLNEIWDLAINNTEYSIIQDKFAELSKWQGRKRWVQYLVNSPSLTKVRF